MAKFGSFRAHLGHIVAPRICAEVALDFVDVGVINAYFLQVLHVHGPLNDVVSMFGEGGAVASFKDKAVVQLDVGKRPVSGGNAHSL